MTPHKDIIVAMLALIAGSHFHGMWRSDEDFVRILEDRKSVNTTYEQLNNSIGRFFKDSALESTQLYLNDTGVIRAHGQVKTDTGEVRKAVFYYLRTGKEGETILIPKTTEQFQKIYNDNRHRKSKRKQDSEEPTDPNKRSRENQVSDTTAENQDSDMTSDEQQSDNEPCTWDHGKVRALFGIMEGDIRMQLRARVALLKNTTSRKKGCLLQGILTEPFEGADSLSSEKSHEFYLKATYLQTAYQIALDEYEVTGGLPWKECCRQAIKVLNNFCYINYVSANIPIMKTVAAEQGWEGSAKGALQILWERGFIDPDQPHSKYSMTVKEAWLDEDGNIKPECEQFYLRGLLEKQPDFKNAKTELEYLTDLLNERYRGKTTIRVIFSPKYHCEIAGLGIECSWGLKKKYYRRKISLERKKNEFSKCVDEALTQVTKDNVRNFCARIHRYMLAYKVYDSNESNTEASYNEIEKFVKKSKTHRSTMDLDTAYLDRIMKETYGVL